MKLARIIPLALVLASTCIVAVVVAQSPRIRRAPDNSRYSTNPRFVSVSPYSNRSRYAASSRSSTALQQPSPQAMPPRPATDPTYMTLEDVSPYYQRPARPKKVGVMMNDIITVVVSERSQAVSEADAERRKNGSYDAVIESWLNLVGGLSLKSTPQRDGDPQAKGKFSQQYKAESDLDIRDRIEFRIAAKVVDIRPNGNIILEAHRSTIINNEQWDASLIGIIRPEDVLPDNTVLSEDIAELMIRREQRGQVRDGIRRGWLTRAIDKFAPF